MRLNRGQRVTFVDIGWVINRSFAPRTIVVGPPKDPSDPKQSPPERIDRPDVTINVGQESVHNIC